MIRKENLQVEMEFVSIEELVPEDHLLRKIYRQMDFGFVRKRMYPLYCEDNGRPAVDPVVLFKMLFIGYLYGIRSERQLVRDIEVNMAYRWFLGLGIKGKVPHASTLSQNRRRRFDGTDVFRELFEDVVEIAAKKGYVDGSALFTDSTHLKANANKHRSDNKVVREKAREYLDDLEKAVDEDRADHGKGPLRPGKPNDKEKNIKESITDPDSGYMTREGKPQGFFYLDHRTCDGAHNLITDVSVTPANVHDSRVYLDRLDYQRKRFGFKVKEVGLDAGYNTAGICRGLVERGIFGVAGYRSPGGKQGMLRRSRFSYDESLDVYVCPEGHSLKYRTTSRPGYREYVSDPEVCAACQRLSTCTKSSNHMKVVVQHVWDKYKQIINQNRLSPRGKAIKIRRCETVERSFADAKQLHGYRYARFRGLVRVEAQCLMTAIVQNMKKIATLMENSAPNPGNGPKTPILNRLFAFFRALTPIITPS